MTLKGRVLEMPVVFRVKFRLIDVLVDLSLGI
jgi:hypothetical protein